MRPARYFFVIQLSNSRDAGWKSGYAMRCLPGAYDAAG